MPLVLASSSPRRRELLQQIGIIPDKIISPEVDETPFEHEKIRGYICRIAKKKAEAVNEPDHYILAADTTVVVGPKMFFKAKDEKEAEQMLRTLSGRRHRIYTAICVKTPSGKFVTRIVKSTVTFKRLSEDEIKNYVQTNEWKGAAGAYSIQGSAARFIKFFQGSYTNVVGLPLYETECLLKGLGCHN